MGAVGLAPVKRHRARGALLHSDFIPWCVARVRPEAAPGTCLPRHEEPRMRCAYPGYCPVSREQGSGPVSCVYSRLALNAADSAASPLMMSFQRSSSPLRRPFSTSFNVGVDGERVQLAVDFDFAAQGFVESGGHAGNSSAKCMCPSFPRRRDCAGRRPKRTLRSNGPKGERSEYPSTLLCRAKVTGFPPSRERRLKVARSLGNAASINLRQPLFQPRIPFPRIRIQRRRALHRLVQVVHRWIAHTTEFFPTNRHRHRRRRARAQ